MALLHRLASSGKPNALEVNNVLYINTQLQALRRALMQLLPRVHIQRHIRLVYRHIHFLENNSSRCPPLL